MRKFIVAAALFTGFIFFNQEVFSQVKQRISLTGTITDERTGEPLAGTNILIQDARIGAVSGNDGKYIINNIPTGHHLIEISHVGYNTIVQHIDIVEETVLNFVLSPAIVENLGVTVTGVTSATSIRRTPVPVTLLRREQLLQTPSTNIIDALRKTPGVSQISTGPAISKPSIRGLGYNRVVVVNEGVRQEGQQWGDEHGIEIDEMSVNRVEILKGPGSIIYGSDALAGVINIITNVPVQEGAVKGNFFSNYQTNNNLWAVHGNVAANHNGFNWNVYGSLRSAMDYRNRYDGRVLNSRFNERNFGGYVGLNKSWGFTHLIYSSFNQNIGLVEGERDDATGRFLLFAETPMERIATNDDLTSRKLFTPNQNVKHQKLISDNSFTFGRSRLKLNLGYQKNLRSEFGNPEDPAEAELLFDLKTFSYNAQFLFPESKEWQTTIGVGGIKQTNENLGEEVIIPEYDLFDIGLFAFTQKTFEKLTFSSGLRYDNRTINSARFEDDNDVKFPAFKKSFSNISGTAGISYQPTNSLTFKANMAKGFRAPTLSELASNGAHEGTNRYEYGRQNLTSEKSLQFDGGVEMNYDHFSFSLNSFYNRINDFIFYRRLNSALGGDSIIIDGGEQLEAFEYNQNNAILTGAEIVFDLHPHPLDWLHFENTFSFVRGRFDREIDGSNNLPMIPAPRWLSEVRANFNNAGKAVKNFYMRLEMDKTFKQIKPFTGYNTETETGGYALLNAGIGGDITGKKGTIMNLHFSVHNLMDKAYQNHLSRLKYAAENSVTGRQGVFNTGRNFSIKMNIPFAFYKK